MRRERQNGFHLYDDFNHRSDIPWYWLIDFWPDAVGINTSVNRMYRCYFGFLVDRNGLVHEGIDVVRLWHGIDDRGE